MSSTSSSSSSSSSPRNSSSGADEFPPVQGGGSLIIAWQVRNRPVLVVGGGNVAAGRILHLLNADAHVTVVCPASGLVAEVAHRIATSASVTHVARAFEPADLALQPWALVLTAIDDAAASSRIQRQCREARIPVNVADVPPECDFYFGSIHRDGPLQIMVSTNGNGPKLANIIRRQIARFLPQNAGQAITRVGELRRRLRKIATAPDEGQRRMEWMSRVSEEWSLQELCEMEEADVDVLLEGYREDRVLGYREVRRKRGLLPEEAGERNGEAEADSEGGKEDWEFDGSFGWAV